MLTITITCLKCTIGIILLLISLLVFIYHKKVRKDKKNERLRRILNDVGDEHFIDWEMNWN